MKFFKNILAREETKREAWFVGRILRLQNMVNLLIKGIGEIKNSTGLQRFLYSLSN